jgi:hypothetical protein
MTLGLVPGAERDEVPAAGAATGQVREWWWPEEVARELYHDVVASP